MKNLLNVFLLGCVSLAFAETGSYSTMMVEVSDVASVEAITERLVGPGLSVVPTGAFVGTTANGQIGFFSGLSFNSEADSVRGRTEIIRNLAAFTNGVVLSTGDISQGQTVSNTVAKKSWGPSEVKYTGADASLSTHQDYDKDLAKLCGEDHSKLNDTVGVVLYIVPRNKTINIPFMMVSEEFFAPNNSFKKPTYTYPDLDRYANYSDKFAFFLERGALSLSDTRDMGMTNNIALLPDRKGIVEISSVNQLTNQDYFVSNVITNGTTDPSIDDGNRLIFPAGDIPLPMEYNGAIVGPTAYATDVIPGETYTIKIVLADRGDRNCNSVIFLAEKSITSGADLKVDVTGPASAEPKGVVTYTDTVSNIGPATADGVVVTNYLPVGAAGVEWDIGGIGQVDDFSPEFLVWTIGDRFAPGSNAVMTVTCTLPDAGGVYTNLASVATDTGDYDESNNTGMCKTVIGNVKLPLTIRAIVTNKVYGAEMSLDNLGFVASITDETNGIYVASGIDVSFTNLATSAEADPKEAGAPVGRYGIYLSNVSGLNLDAFDGVTYVSGELVITQALLTISVSNAEWRIGSNWPPHYGIEDFSEQLTNGDTPEQITGGGALAYSNLVWSASQPTTGEDVDTYVDEIWLKRDCLVGEKNANYSIRIEPGDLTVLAPLPKLTISAISTSKAQGTEMSLPALDFVATIDGTNGTQVVTGIDVSFTNDQNAVDYPTNATAAVGEYKIYLSNVRGLDPADFSEIEYVPGTLTVTEARYLHVYAIDTNKVYGSELLLDSLEFVASIDGTNGTEKVSGIDVAFTNAQGEVACPTNLTAVAGTYGIVISNIQGFATSGFTGVTYHPGTLTVDKRPLEITVNSLQKDYGDWYDLEGPHVYYVSGGELVNGDTIKKINFTCAGTAETADFAKAGYPITARPEDVIGEDGNRIDDRYEIVVKPGVLYVRPYPITITANDVTNCYGEVSTFDGTEFTVAPADLPNGDTVRTVTLTNVLAATTPVDDDPYENAIRPSHEVTGINTNNYKISFVDGKLVITQAVLTITANSKTRPYGTTIPILGTDFATLPTALPNGETVDAVTITCPEAGQWDASLGIHPIVPSHDVTGSLDTNNYNIVFVDGTLTVTPTVFTASAEPVTKYYDGTPTNIVVKLQGLPAPVIPTFEYSYAENDGYVSAAAFTGPTNVEESAEVWCRAIAPGTTNTVHEKVTILPRVVVEQADSATRAYNGEPLTNDGHSFKENEASDLAKSVYFDRLHPDIYDGDARSDWADAVGFANPDGIVTAPMTGASKIIDPGTQSNVIDPDAVTFTASTKTNNYVINYLDGQLTVTLSTALTLEVSDVEKFYDAEPTNVAYVAKVSGTPIADAEVRLHEQGTANWVLAADFEPYLDTTNVIVDVAVAKHGYVAVTNSATLLIKPRLVTLVAGSDEKTYDGTPLTNWTFEVKADTMTPGYGFVKEEGVERVEMTAASTITEPGTVDNVIAAKFAKAGTKLARNYVVSTENGTLTVDPLGVLTVEAAAAEKFYDAVPTNIAYVVKVDGEPTDDATVSLREKGTEAWIAADDFPAYLNATNATVQVMATKPGYLAATDEAAVWIKPRIVVHHAESGKWEYDGTIHTQPDYFEDEDEEAALSKAKWDTDGVLPNSTGFVADEGYAAQLVMTADSSIKDPGKKPNVIDQSAEKAALKAGTNPVNYEFHYLDGELEVTSTAVIKTTVSAKLNWDTGLLDLTLTIKNVGEGAVYSASDYWVELTPGPAGTESGTSVARTYYLNAPTGTLPNGADYVNLTAAVKAALVSAGGDEIFGPGEEITVKGVSVYHWKRWSPDKFLDADAFFRTGLIAEQEEQTAQQVAQMPASVLTVKPNSTKYGSVSGGGTYEAGKIVQLKATAKDGYVFVGWFADKDCTKKLDSEGYDYRKPTIKITMPAKATTIYAKFISVATDKSGLKFSDSTAKLAKTAKAFTASKDVSLSIGFSSKSYPQVTASGLPDGLSIDAITGKITGTVKKPGAYTVKVMVTSAAGNRITQNVKIDVKAPSWATGSFSGYGAVIVKGKTVPVSATFTATEVGKVSGKVIYKGKASAFTASYASATDTESRFTVSFSADGVKFKSAMSIKEKTSGFTYTRAHALKSGSFELEMQKVVPLVQTGNSLEGMIGKSYTFKYGFENAGLTKSGDKLVVKFADKDVVKLSGIVGGKSFSGLSTSVMACGKSKTTTQYKLNVPVIGGTVKYYRLLTFKVTVDAKKNVTKVTKTFTAID